MGYILAKTVAEPVRGSRPQRPNLTYQDAVLDGDLAAVFKPKTEPEADSPVPPLPLSIQGVDRVRRASNA